MATEQEIRDNYQAQHDTLSADYYAGTSGLTKEQFDTQHGQVWANMEATLIAEGYINPPEPPRSTYMATIDAIDVAMVRPIRIKRVWDSNDYFYDCFVTETVKDQYIAGDVAVGDYVLVHFDDIGEQIVTAKVFKSW